jgi:hypothetical protein
MEAELGVFVGEDLGLACPEGMSHLQAVGGVGCAKLAGLDEEGKESSDKEKQGDRVRGSEAEHCSLWYVRCQAQEQPGILAGASTIY